MNAKEYLSQVMRIDQRINSKLEQLQKLRASSTKANATLSDMPRPESPDLQRLETTVAKIVDLENEINRDIDTLVNLRGEIYHLIQTVPDVNQQLLLELRYLCFKSWREIAETMGLEERYVLKVHGRALNAVGKIISKWE